MNDEEIRTVAQDLYRRLESAWNAADGDAFAEPFTNDADFVDITGSHHRSKRAIAEGHKAIFATIYKGSTIAVDVIGARQLAPETLLVHGRVSMGSADGAARRQRPGDEENGAWKTPPSTTRSSASAAGELVSRGEARAAHPPVSSSPRVLRARRTARPPGRRRRANRAPHNRKSRAPGHGGAGVGLRPWISKDISDRADTYGSSTASANAASPSAPSSSMARGRRTARSSRTPRAMALPGPRPRHARSRRPRRLMDHVGGEQQSFDFEPGGDAYSGLAEFRTRARVQVLRRRRRDVRLVKGRARSSTSSTACANVVAYSGIASSTQASTAGSSTGELHAGRQLRTYEGVKTHQEYSERYEDFLAYGRKKRAPTFSMVRAWDESYRSGPLCEEGARARRGWAITGAIGSGSNA
jgi:uncharacterized protein (TIGR02246 family)